LQEDLPSEQQSCNILCLLGKLYSHLLEVYTYINLSLHQQLIHLSVAAHLILAFYVKEKGGAMPSQLYFDLMTMIKNAYLCIAKTQIDDPEGSFWIILLGSDPLKASGTVIVQSFSPRLITCGALDKNFVNLSYWMRSASSDMKANFQITFKATSETWWSGPLLRMACTSPIFL
jgi:hypothetical protein